MHTPITGSARSLCNRERATQIMEKYGLDALCCTDAHNVYYLSNFESTLLWHWARVALAIYPRDPQRPPTLVIPGLDLPTLLPNPTWMSDVRLYVLREMGGHIAQGDLKPMIREGAELGYYEAQAVELFDEYKTLQTASPTIAFSQVLRDLKLENGTLGFDDVRLGIRVKEQLPMIEMVDTLDIMREIRVVKTEPELELMRVAAKCNEAALMAAIDTTRVGVEWREVTRAFDLEMIRQGAQPFNLNRGSGEPAKVRVQIKDYKIAPGDFVFYDAAGYYKHYWADLGRTAYMGEAPAELKKHLDAMRAGWNEGCEKVRPGMSSLELGRLIRDSVRKAGFPAYEIAIPHSVGLEHFDHPQMEGFYSGWTIEENSVLNVDMPYIEMGWGSMHIEDTVVVRKDGVEFLTSNNTALIELPVEPVGAR